MMTHKDIEEMITDVFRDSVPNFGLDIEVTSTYNNYDRKYYKGSSGLTIKMKDGTEFEIEIRQR